jgi:gamma-glutamylcyclotransferase (GGCT)/AIG2-like uncharacterized protein YtfP
MSYLFVYGTLLKNYNHFNYKYLKKYAKFKCKGLTKGKLYKISWYPGLKRANNLVYGEVYKIKNKKLLKILDNYEGCNYKDKFEYKRVLKTIYCKRKRIKAYTYIYCKKVNYKNLIKSGNFLKEWRIHS